MSGHGGHSVFVCVKQEEFTFRSGLGFDPLSGRPVKNVLKNRPGTALVFVSILVVDVADHARHFALLGTPWEDRKSIEIRIKIHIRLFDTGKTLEGRTVEGAFVFKRMFQLPGGDRHIFHHTAHIGELEADKFHILLLGNFKDLTFCIFCHFLMGTAASGLFAPLSAGTECP